MMIGSFKSIIITVLLIGIIDAAKNKKESTKNLGLYFSSSTDSETQSYSSTSLNLAPVCPLVKSTCDPNSPYRNVDGSCNNLKYPWWGSRNSPFHRFLQPDYDDAISYQRTLSEIDGQPLSGARHVAKLVPTQPDFQTSRSTAFTFFGQFLAHDMSLTAPGKSDCYSKECNTTDPICFNIRLPAYGDSLTDLDGTRTQDCLKFTRADDVRNVFDCDFKRREPYNKNSHFIDLSGVYGSTPAQTKLVRAYKGGLLKFSITPGSELEALPIQDISKCKAKLPETTSFEMTSIGIFKKTADCFFAGDIRSGDVCQLSAIHTIFLREHNRIARTLYKINTQWSDETLFQETKRILIAIYQNIVYSEWLPLLIGVDLMKKFDLMTLNQGYLYKYNEYVYPNVYAENVAAGFRLHHLVHREIPLATADFVPINGASSIPLQNYLDNQALTFQKLNSILYGLPMIQTYPHNFQMNDGLNNHFRQDFPADGDKSSLLAINIQRGRDFGLPSYSHYRYLAGQNYPTKFEDLTNFADTSISILKSIYRNVQDIDLIVGLMAESRSAAGLISQTHEYLIAKQFYNLKFGDRFYFENGENEKTRFTSAQLSAIRQIKFSTLLCNSLKIPTMPLYGFLQLAPNADTKVGDFPNNPRTPCSTVPKLDLRLWKASTKY